MPDARATRIEEARTRVRRFVRRRRRPLAAVSAGLAALLALTGLRSPAAPAQEPTEASSRAWLSSGNVAVPITLSTPALARTVAVGDVVDIVSVSSADDPSGTAARVVVRAVRVVEVPDAGGSFTAAATPVIVLEVPEAQAVPLISASLGSSLAVAIRRHASSH